MLRTVREDGTCFITQPAHAELAGYLAAHWGNTEFARPGQYAPAPDPARLRAETILAITQHDNGWWEWEASPDMAEADGLPADLSTVLRDHEASMNRWRLGIPRLRRAHPYASLLISVHPYWLYAPRVLDGGDPAFLHPLFRPSGPEAAEGEEADAVRGYVEEVDRLRWELLEEVRSDPATREWVEPQHLHPHSRLLQVLDGLSLYLCSALIPARQGEARGQGADEVDLLHVPRRNWEDRVTVRLRPAGERRVRLSPYPFDVAPLRATVPTKRFSHPPGAGESFADLWPATPLELIEFVLEPGAA